MVEICPTTSVFWCNQKKLIHFQFFSCCKNGNVTSKHFPVGAESISHTGLFSNIFIESLGHTENIKKCKMHRIKYCSCTIVLHMCYIASVVSDSWWRSPPGFLLHGILQARIVEWVAMPSSKGSSWTRGRTRVSCIVGEFFTDWATREAPHIYVYIIKNIEIRMKKKIYIYLNHFSIHLKLKQHCKLTILQ